MVINTSPLTAMRFDNVRSDFLIVSPHLAYLVLPIYELNEIIIYDIYINILSVLENIWTIQIRLNVVNLPAQNIYSPQLSANTCTATYHS